VVASRFGSGRQIARIEKTDPSVFWSWSVFSFRARDTVTVVSVRLATTSAWASGNVTWPPPGAEVVRPRATVVAVVEAVAPCGGDWVTDPSTMAAPSTWKTLTKSLGCGSLEGTLYLGILSLLTL
jgi:hypothetical protein